MERKKIVILVLILMVLMGALFWLKLGKNNGPKDSEQNANSSTEPIKICYYYQKSTDRGFYDRFWLKLNITGEKISGEFDSYPAEKDSKTGNFEGTVGPVNKETMSRTADVWWNSFAEGMKVKEELMFEFGDGSAAVLGGEMKDRGDGVYVYTDKNNFHPWPTMWQIDCEKLDQKLAAEKFIVQ